MELLRFLYKDDIQTESLVRGGKLSSSQIRKPCEIHTKCRRGQKMKFWFNCLAHLMLPKGHGYQARLRDKPCLEKAKRGKAAWVEVRGVGWQTTTHGVKKRNYASRDDYQQHQAAKLDVIVGKGHGFRKIDILEYRIRFWRRFRHLRSFLDPDANLLCLGARQGTEVEVLRELGYRNASGIDLNPGPDNPLVNHGDFANIEVPDNYLDLVYTNCLDHAFGLDEFFIEQTRVLKDSGLILMDITTNDEAGHFESMQWNRPEDVLVVALQYFRNIVMLQREKRWVWTLMSHPIKRHDP